MLFGICFHPTTSLFRMKWNFSLVEELKARSEPEGSPIVKKIWLSNHPINFSSPTVRSHHRLTKMKFHTIVGACNLILHIDAVVN